MTKPKARSRRQFIPTQRSKYRNKKTKVDGITFDSKKEANRYVVLHAMQNAGSIRDLEIQKRFLLKGQYGNLKGGSGRPLFYVADFTYYDAEGNWIIEDVKGMRTDVYRLKKAIMQAMGFEVTEL